MTASLGARSELSPPAAGYALITLGIAHESAERPLPAQLFGE